MFLSQKIHPKLCFVCEEDMTKKDIEMYKNLDIAKKINKQRQNKHLFF